MPLNEPDCSCPYPYRVQVGNTDAIGREVKYFICCLSAALEKLTGVKFHEIMYDIEPGETPPLCGESKPAKDWPYGQRIIAEKRALGFRMEGV